MSNLTKCGRSSKRRRISVDCDWHIHPNTDKCWHYSLGKRTDESLRNLLGKLSAVQITRFYTDNWESYQNLIPEVRHWIGKAGTQRIERQNLNFRTHLKRLQRRTICFSKTRKMLEAVVRLYIHQLNSSSISFVT